MKRLLLSLILLAAAGRAPAAEPFVAKEATGFVHFKVAELYKHPSLKEYRGIFEKAGTRAFEALDEQFVPKPSTLVTVTAMMLPTPGGKNPFEGFVVAAQFSEAFDAAAVVKAYFPDAKASPKVKKLYLPAEPVGTAVFFPDDKTMVVGSAAILPKLASASGGGSPLLTSVKADVEAGAVLYGAVNVSALPIPPEVFADVPEEFHPILKAESISFALTMSGKPVAKLQMNYADAAAANQADKSLRKAAEVGRKFLAQPREQAEAQLFGKKPKDGYRKLDDLPDAVMAVGMLAGINFADEILADLPVKKEGSSLVFRAAIPEWMAPYLGLSGLSAGLMLPAVQKVRQAATMATSTNNLKQIVLAMQTHNDSFNALPPSAITSKTGKPLLSWRVAILPFLEQDALYRQFKLDEPWDSENNKKLIPLMPKIYADPRAVSTEPGKTSYKVFTGKDAVFSPLGKRTIQGIQDGSSNTIIVVSAGEGVTWTKPEDIEFDMDKPFPDLTTVPSLLPLLVGFADGSVRAVNIKAIKDLDKTMKIYVNPNDGMVVPELP